jgi:hypothetical protein
MKLGGGFPQCPRQSYEFVLALSAGFTFVAQSVEMFGHMLPAVFPVPNHILKHTKRGPLSARRDMLDTSQQFWHISQFGCVGQISANLKLGVDAWFKLAEGFKMTSPAMTDVLDCSASNRPMSLCWKPDPGAKVGDL